MTDGGVLTELSRALLSLRRAAGIRQVDLGDVTQPQLSRIEQGKALPTEAQTEALARRYGAGEDRIAELVVMTRDANAGVSDSRLVVQRGNTLALQQRWSRIEGEASTIRAYQSSLVLGVLQATGYAAVALRQPVDSDAVRSRQERHDRMLSDQGRQFVLIQDEGALRKTVGSPSVMNEQIATIRRLMDAPNVEVGIIPTRRPMPFVVTASFHIYDATAVVVGLEVAAATLTDSTDVTHFRGVWDRLAELAAWGDEAREVLVDVARWHGA